MFSKLHRDEGKGSIAGLAGDGGRRDGRGEEKGGQERD